MKIYLAGPDVFLPHAADILSEKKAICAELGIEAYSPFDTELELLPNEQSPKETGHIIARANFALMETCEGVMANLTPFRGPSADVGTAGEMFYMAGRGKNIFAYSNSADNYVARIHERIAVKNLFFDAQGFKIENFSLWDNLMLPEVIERSGGIFMRSLENREMDDLDIFRRLAAKVAETYLSK